MKQPPKKPAGKTPVKGPAKTPVKAPAKPPVKAPAKAPPKKEPIVSEEELTENDIPSHPPEIEEPVVEPSVPDAPPTPPAPPEDKPLTIGGEKVDPVKVLGFLESIAGTLTFRSVALVALLTAIGLVLFAFYENRTEIVDRFTTRKPVATAPIAINPTKWVLSEASKQSLIALANATNVKMVLLSDVDLRKNRRIVRYYYIEDQSLKLGPLALQALSLPLPVFDYDPKNTEQMTAVLSNDFRCDPFVDTVYNKFAPELADQFPTVCRIAVPPFVGTFVGFITVGIAPGVSSTELETIRLEVSRIAVEIYMNDVAKKTTTPIN